MAIKFSDIFNTDQSSINNEKLEEALNKTKGVTETMGKKSAKYLDLNKKRIERLDAKTKLSKLYEKYGKLCYGIIIGDDIAQEVLTDIESQIARLRAKIQDYNQKIEDAKSSFNESVKQRSRSPFSQEKEVQVDDAVEVTEDIDED
ncbi:MAG: hypothetical protein LUG95_02765 [Clostridiales bacterium]|nr:hypothetical protein [Clostridiales bacterium]